MGDFQLDESENLERLEQAVFEWSRLVANLAATDGAVVLDKRFTLLGFGAEVSAELPAPERVWRALDAEGVRREPDELESVGTRHRAACRFVHDCPGGLAIVISAGRRRFLRRQPGGRRHVLGTIREPLIVSALGLLGTVAGRFCQDCAGDDVKEVIGPRRERGLPGRPAERRPVVGKGFPWDASGFPRRSRLRFSISPRTTVVLPAPSILSSTGACRRFDPDTVQPTSTPIGERQGLAMSGFGKIGQALAHAFARKIST